MEWGKPGGLLRRPRTEASSERGCLGLSWSRCWRNSLLARTGRALLDRRLPVALLQGGQGHGRNELFLPMIVKLDHNIFVVARHNRAESKPRMFYLRALRIGWFACHSGKGPSNRFYRKYLHLSSGLVPPNKRCVALAPCLPVDIFSFRSRRRDLSGETMHSLATSQSP